MGNNKQLPPCEIHVDQEGEWFHRGNRIVRPEILEVLYSKLEQLPDGSFILTEKGESCRLDVADTPFVITRIDAERDNSGKERILLKLKHLEGFEVLEPETVKSGRGNVLYCRVRGGRHLARFSRSAYYQIADFFREEIPEESYCIELNGRKFAIGIDEKS